MEYGLVVEPLPCKGVWCSVCVYIVCFVLVCVYVYLFICVYVHSMAHTCCVVMDTVQLMLNCAVCTCRSGTAAIVV